MKTVVLMRHAKAEPEYSDCRDFDRSLTEDGRAMAQKSAEQLKEAGIQVGQILTSSARRTLQTAQIVAETLCPDAPLLAMDELYLAAPASYITAVRQQAENDIHSVLLVGHNPGIAQLMSSWAEDHFSVPPATISVFQIPLQQWEQLSEGQSDCELKLLVQHGHLSH